MGYHQAGFEVVGVDKEPQPNYPFEFIQADALEWLWTHSLQRFDAIHASPPCQKHSTVSGRSKKGRKDEYPDLIDGLRWYLVFKGLPYIIENVIGAPLKDPVMLCGSSFGLDLRRHRLFESSLPLEGKPCDHSWQTPRFQSLDASMAKAGRLASVVGVHGNCNYAGEAELRCKAMGIDWMTQKELTQAIPPAYTEFLGKQLITHTGYTHERLNPPTPR